MSKISPSPSAYLHIEKTCELLVNCSSSIPEREKELSLYPRFRRKKIITG
jgi:hypothetical protein